MAVTTEPGVVRARPQEYDLLCPKCGKTILRWEVPVALVGEGEIRIKGVCRNRQCVGHGKERVAVVVAGDKAHPGR